MPSQGSRRARALVVMSSAVLHSTSSNGLQPSERKIRLVNTDTHQQSGNSITARYIQLLVKPASRHVVNDASTHCPLSPTRNVCSSISKNCACGFSVKTGVSLQSKASLLEADAKGSVRISFPSWFAGKR